MDLQSDSNPRHFRRKKLAFAFFGLVPIAVLAAAARVVQKWSGTSTVDAVVLSALLGTSLALVLSMGTRQMRLQFNATGVRQPGIVFTRCIRWEDVIGWKTTNSYLILRSEQCLVRILVWQFAEPHEVVKFVLEQLERANPERWARDNAE
jgi:hypothetical protein